MVRNSPCAELNAIWTTLYPGGTNRSSLSFSSRSMAFFPKITIKRCRSSSMRLLFMVESLPPRSRLRQRILSSLDPTAGQRDVLAAECEALCCNSIEDGESPASEPSGFKSGTVLLPGTKRKASGVPSVRGYEKHNRRGKEPHVRRYGRTAGVTPPPNPIGEPLSVAAGRDFSRVSGRSNRQS
jgi:hypothetical protein